MDAATDNFTFTLIGNTPFSGNYRGIQEMFEKSIGPVMSNFEALPRLIVDRLIAELDYVVVINHGEGRITKERKGYNNTYCNVIRLEESKIAKVIEYSDTALVNAVLHKD